MDAFEADESVGAVVVTGTPPAFCAGANLGNLAEADGESLGRIYEGFLRVARSPLPTIAAVNGAAVGAGMNLALGCDVRIAARRARFDTRFMQLGLHPGGGHTWMLRRIAGPQVDDGRRAVRRGARRRGGGPGRVSRSAASTTTTCCPTATRWRPGGERATSADRHDEADDRRDGRRSPTIRQPSRPSSNRSCGRPASRGSPSVWRPSRLASAAVHRREVE